MLNTSTKFVLLVWLLSKSLSQVNLPGNRATQKFRNMSNFQVKKLKTGCVIKQKVKRLGIRIQITSKTSITFHARRLRIMATVHSDVNGCTIAQAVSRWLPTAAARGRSQVWSCAICDGQSGTGASSLRVLRFPLPIIIPPNYPLS
jgi:hypothetical protein